MSEREIDGGKELVRKQTKNGGGRCLQTCKQRERERLNCEGVTFFLGGGGPPFTLVTRVRK